MMSRVQKPVDVKRDARINLAFTPEMKKQLEDIAAVDEISVNALVEKICAAYVSCRADDLSELKNFRARIRKKNSDDISVTFDVSPTDDKTA